MPVSMDRRGFTLIEGVISVGIIGSALIVGLSLAYSNLQAAQSNADRILAAHLAREGIEVIRNIRDSNWLRYYKGIDKNNSADGGVEPDVYNWNDFFNGWPTMPTGCLTDSTCYDSYFDIILNSTDVQPAATYMYTLRQDITHTDTLACINNIFQPSCRVRKTSDGVYYQAAGSVTEATPFYRRIKLQPICLTNTPVDTNLENDTLYVDTGDTNYNPTDACGAPSGLVPVGVLVTSHVVWQRGGKTLEVKYKERLYDWRILP